MMPRRSYLRGSTVKSAKRYAIENEIDRLKREVALNKKETQYVQASGTFSSAGALVYEHDDYDISEALRTSTNFNEIILGDKWRNKYVDIIMNIQHQELYGFRFVVYHAMNPSTAMNGSLGNTTMSTTFDPSAFKILHDEHVRAHFDNERIQIKRRVNLRNLVSVWNRSSSNWEKGRVRMCLIWETDGSHTNTVVEARTLHAFQNI